MPLPIIGGAGSSGSGGPSGIIDPAVIDARIATWARANAPSGTAPVAQLPGLRQRFAYYEAINTSPQNLDDGDFDPPLNIQTLTLRGGAASSSILDRWDGTNHPWNIAGSYIDFANVNDDEILTLSVCFFDDINAGYAFRVSLRDDQDQVVATLPLVSTISSVQQTDADPRAGVHLLPIGSFVKPANPNVTRGVIEFILAGDRENTSFNVLKIVGSAAYG